MVKKILIVIIAATLIGSAIAYKMYNKPHADIAAEKSVANLSADELLTAFKENETNANAMYTSKTVSVTGKILNQKTEKDIITVQLETSDLMNVIICNLDQFTKHQKTSFNPGEQVTFKGTCSGYLSDVILDRCILINP